MSEYKNLGNAIRQVVFNTKDQPVPIKDSIIDKLDVSDDDILELNEEAFELEEGPTIGDITAYVVLFNVREPGKKKSFLPGEALVAAKNPNEAKRKVETDYKKQFPGMTVSIKGIKSAVKTSARSGGAYWSTKSGRNKDPIIHQEPRTARTSLFNEYNPSEENDTDEQN